jgi:hypothetical protein
MNTELNTELNTPRTDAQAGWAIANQYGQSAGSELLGDPNGVFVHAVFARTLERELHESRNAERLARVQLGNEREKVKRLVEINEFVGSAQLKAERAEAELATERARLDYLQEWGFDFLTRAAIDAAMKEDGA